MNLKLPLRLAFPLLGIAALAGAPAASAQQAEGGAPKAAPKTSKASPKAAPKEDAGARAAAGDAQLRQRVDHLEEQLTDMQVVIGTLESLGRGGGSAAPAGAAPQRGGGGGGVDQARLDSLETQIRALTNQVEALADQLRQQGGGRRSESHSPAMAAGQPVREAAAPRLDGIRTDEGTRPAPASAEPRGGVPAFGTTTVSPGAERDPIGALLGPDSGPSAPAGQLPPAAAAAGSPKELYETAYGYLLQQDYSAAEVAFDEFIRRYPADRLAADAQYWLGESLYVQRRYKQAGQAFLRVIEKHTTSAKVPGSILKLAQTLEQLGQKDCTLFSELETRHPNATPDIRSKARALKQRVGCG